jgi:benzoate membrane transport protein
VEIDLPLEPTHRPFPRIRKLLADYELIHLSNAVIAFLFAASAPIAIVLAVGTTGGLTEAELASWIFGGIALNGLLGIVISVIYRQPLAFFWTISGTVLVGPALQHSSFPEVIGAFLGTGLLLLVLGLSGWIKRIMAVMPMPIIMAMVAGVFLEFGLDWIKALGRDPWVAGPMTVAFILLSLNANIAKRFPPMIGVLVVGIIVVSFAGSFSPDTELEYVIITPTIIRPEFSWMTMVELVIPIAVTVLAAQNAQGIVILRNVGHNPPTNLITAACGGASIITAFFGTVSTCLTGPVNAILSSGGKLEQQYIAVIIIGIFAILFGLHAPLMTKLLLAMPASFIATLAGLALIRVLQSAFVVSFGGSFTLGALVSFLVTLADQSIFNIGAPFWGLVFGVATSWLLEKKDFEGGMT